MRKGLDPIFRKSSGISSVRMPAPIGVDPLLYCDSQPDPLRRKDRNVSGLHVPYPREVKR
jgi:hypothetical protein